MISGKFCTVVIGSRPMISILSTIIGHSHTNIDTIIGNTRIVCNQLGYVYYKEHLTNGFDPGKVIEI